MSGKAREKRKWKMVDAGNCRGDPRSPADADGIGKTSVVDGWRQFFELPGRARLAPTVMWGCAGWDVEDAVPTKDTGGSPQKTAPSEDGAVGYGFKQIAM